MLSIIRNFPNRNLFDGDGTTCPNCASYKVQKRGTLISKTAKKQRYQCLDCASWSSETKKGLVSI